MIKTLGQCLHYGTVQYENGDCYVGSIVGLSIRHGTGRYCSLEDNGSSYEGAWSNGKREGIGREARGGLRYVGFWKNDLREGFGLFVDEIHHTEYQGNWKQGFMHGFGILTSKRNKAMYYGEWNNGAIHGAGVWEGPEGRFEGIWRNGKFIKKDRSLARIARCTAECLSIVKIEELKDWLATEQPSELATAIRNAINTELGVKEPPKVALAIHEEKAPLLLEDTEKVELRQRVAALESQLLAVSSELDNLKADKAEVPPAAKRRRIEEKEETEETYAPAIVAEPSIKVKAEAKPEGTKKKRNSKKAKAASKDEPTEKNEEAKSEFLPPGTYFPYEALLNKSDLPAGVNAARREHYLSTEDFVKVFGMTRKEFHQLKTWKKVNLKKKKGLF